MKHWQEATRPLTIKKEDSSSGSPQEKHRGWSISAPTGNYYFMIGPFSSIRHISIPTRKYSGKKRLIIDLYFPHVTTTPSINSFIPGLDFFMPYTTITQAINNLSRQPWRLVGKNRHHQCFQVPARLPRFPQHILKRPLLLCSLPHL